MRNYKTDGRFKLSLRRIQRLSVKSKLIIGGSSLALIGGVVFAIFNSFNYENSKAAATAVGGFTLTSSTTKSGASVSQITWNHVNLSGTNQLMIVGVTTKDKPVTSVKYNNVALTLAGTTTKNSMTAYLYYMANPPIGTYSLKVNTSASTEIYAGGDVFDGVDLNGSFTAYTNNGVSTSPTSGSVTATTVQYLFSVIGTIQQIPSLTIGLTSGHSVGSAFYNASAFKVASSTVTNSFTLTSSQSWAIVSILVKPSIALPVTWKALTVVRNDGNVTVNWVTASEINNDYFIVQRSFDGVNYIDVSKVKGNGNTTYDSEYFENDHADPFKDLYYRIKQVDFDGKFDYSAVRFLKAKKAGSTMLVYPTIANDQITIQLPEVIENDNYSCSILNVSGKPVFQQVISGSELVRSYDINTQNLERGNYVVIIMHSAEIVGKGRFIRN